jgi:hypothetical protein
MLEQAILDAKELKEAAIKNAQQSLVEKYSNEFESEIEKLLEQADPTAGAIPAPAAGATPAPTAAGSTPVDPEVAKNDGDNKSDIFEKLEYAFKDGEVIEDKAYPTGVVEIDLDSLSEFSFKKNQEKTPEQMALQELKKLSLKEQLEERIFDDEEDYENEKEMEDEEDEDTSDDLFPYGDSDEDEDIEDEHDSEIDDEFTDEDDEDESDEDLYDSDHDEGEFEIDFETDPDDADYDPDANIDDEDYDDEEDYEDDEDEDYDSDEEDEEYGENNEAVADISLPGGGIYEVKSSVKKKATALAAAALVTHGDIKNVVKKTSEFASKKPSKEKMIGEGEHKHSGAVEEILMKIEALQNSLKNKKINDSSVEARLESIIKAVKKLTDEEKKELKEAIKLDYKRTGPRSQWTGMFHEEAQHDVELANLQAQIEEMEQEVEHLQESNKKLKAGLKDSINMIEKITAKKDSYGRKIQQYEEKLHESRILNYKLLYTNKALSDASLNERQKEKIAESINNAKSAEEVKLLYETLKSTMRDGTSSSSSPKSLSEAVERRSSSLLLKASRAEAPKQNDYAERMKKLAGLA